MRILAVAVMILAFGGGVAHAQIAEQSLDNPVLEQRARLLMNEVRCIVCAGQSVADSDATLAQDMRRMIREQIAAGHDDQSVRAIIRTQYGDGIFLRPPFARQTWILWGAPFLLLLAGGIVVAYQFRFVRRRGKKRP